MYSLLKKIKNKLKYFQSKIKNTIISFWNSHKNTILYSYSSVLVKISGKERSSRQILLSLKDKYKGKRCFILGNGPSLTKEDVNKLKNEITFASNRIYKMFEYTDWRPTFYAMIDEGVGQDEGVIENTSKISATKFFRMEGWYVYHKIKGDSCYIHSWYSRKYLDNPNFSFDLTKGAYTIATVTFFIIQIAVWMGFSEIYLLGCDNSYRIERNKDGQIVTDSTKKSYFGNQERESAKSVGSPWECNVAFECAEKFSKTHDFKIYNATRGGMLEVFERKNLDEIL